MKFLQTALKQRLDSIGVPRVSNASTFVGNPSDRTSVDFALTPENKQWRFVGVKN